MTTRTVVHLLRHGEVQNPDGVLYGRLPGFHLSPAGVVMAEHAAKAVADRDIVTIVSSPLVRARRRPRRWLSSSMSRSRPMTG